MNDELILHRPGAAGILRPSGLAACLALLVATAPAQQQFDELRKRALPSDVRNVHAMARGDVDGDGDLDLLLGAPGLQVQLWINDGVATFRDDTAARMPSGAFHTLAMVLGDVDLDGDLDLILGISDTAGNRLYRNDGTGTFIEAPGALPALGGATRSLVLADVDGDGDPDLFTGNHTWHPGIENRLFLNDGTGSFSVAPGGSLPARHFDRTGAVVAGDFDGDGDLDLICGNGYLVSPGEQNRLYLNTGSGRFVDATAGRLPVRRDPTWSVAVEDVDGDGDLDLVFGNTFGHPDQLCLNDGTGTFTDAPAGWMPAVRARTTSVRLVDLDGDRDPDLALAAEGRERIYSNDGAGRFTDVTDTRFPWLDSRTYAMVDGDFDGDGDIDLAFGNVDSVERLCLNEGPGTFVDATAGGMSEGLGGVRHATSGDIDGDGDVDVVTARLGQNQVYVNSGATGLVNETATRLPSSGVHSNAVALGDVDGDGDLDLAVANGFFRSPEQDQLYLNDGSGRFLDVTGPQLPSRPETTTAVLFGDLDADGDLDLLFGIADSSGGGLGVQNRLFLNNGRGLFTDVTGLHLPAVADQTAALAVGDVDGDGDLDLLCGNMSDATSATGQNRLLLNNGRGVFTEVTATQLPASTLDNTRQMVLEDIDGDGDLDLLTAEGQSCRSWRCSGGQNRVYVNDGTGRFTDETASRLPVLEEWTNALRVTDLDHDGDGDLIFDGGPQVRIHRNDGTGHYVDVTAALVGPVTRMHPIQALEIGDFDGDRDMDLFLGGYENGLLFNLQHQIVVPLVPRVGHDLILEAYARQGPTTAFDIALPYVSPSAAATPIRVPPLGTLGLDPTVMLPLPNLVIPQPAGVGSLAVPIPNDPNLAGVTIHVQALLVQYPFDVRLSNVTADRILR